MSYRLCCRSVWANHWTNNRIVGYARGRIFVCGHSVRRQTFQSCGGFSIWLLVQVLHRFGRKGTWSNFLIRRRASRADGWLGGGFVWRCPCDQFAACISAHSHHKLSGPCLVVPCADASCCLRPRFFGLQSFCALEPTGKPSGVAISDCISQHEIQLFHAARHVHHRGIPRYNLILAHLLIVILIPRAILSTIL